MQGMTWEEWSEAYPPPAVDTLPEDCIEAGPFKTHREADDEKEGFEDQEWYGHTIVKYNGEYYVVSKDLLEQGQ